MRYLGALGDVTIPTLPTGQTLDPSAKALLVAQVNALPLDQQNIFCDVSDASSEGHTRLMKRYAIGAAGGLALGVLGSMVLAGGVFAAHRSGRRTAR